MGAGGDCRWTKEAFWVDGSDGKRNSFIIFTLICKFTKTHTIAVSEFVVLRYINYTSIKLGFCFQAQVSLS